MKRGIPSTYSSVTLFSVQI